MIQLNCSLIVETSENVKPLMEQAIELVAFSLHDKGCISYDFYQSLTNDDRFMILETWESEEALKAHSESDHFKRIVPRLKELATMTLERFDF
ncbi:MAG: antibiotic biosynthesis monooxygenase [Bacteroides sp.]|nr:antibiotic biosynthesis monooxygenase [Bacteroides sp.]MDE5805233.1 antibiotic biosynthesis monooxygenase [Paramuribaculum sp.]MBD5297611.1 antibiotic biosynthesis monooxygenase [Bacteroides sp.]MBD5321090.1 antibiotic biosynthesis monooxygenase [Bacteroides sp.]MBD5350202.1 antibiotic biosynthesis monooxygenase [Bacteroides sp.]